MNDRIGCIAFYRVSNLIEMHHGDALRRRHKRRPPPGRTL